MLHGKEFTTGAFQAVAWKLGIKSNPRFCWRSKPMGSTVKYSNDTVAFIKRLTSGDVELAKTEYRERNRKKKDVFPVTARVPLAAGQQQAAS